jgi:hypothetical protein
MSINETEVINNNNHWNKVIGSITMFTGVLLWVFLPAINTYILKIPPCKTETIITSEWVNLGMPAALLLFGFLIITGQNIISLFKK